RNTHQRLGYCRREITSQRYTFSFLQPVGKCAGESLNDILRSLGKALYQSNNTAARFQGLSQKYGQYRIEHFRRGISKETRRGEQERISREPGEVLLHASLILFIFQSMQNFGNAFEFGHLLILQFGKVGERLVVNLSLGFILG